jgi:hypothetical protein
MLSTVYLSELLAAENSLSAEKLKVGKPNHKDERNQKQYGYEYARKQTHTLLNPQTGDHKYRNQLANHCHGYGKCIHVLAWA